MGFMGTDTRFTFHPDLGEMRRQYEEYDRDRKNTREDAAMDEYDFQEAEFMNRVFYILETVQGDRDLYAQLLAMSPGERGQAIHAGSHVHSVKDALLGASDRTITFTHAMITKIIPKLD